MARKLSSSIGLNLIEIGKTVEDKPQPIRMSLPKLIDSRALVQATSGAGKSWMVRVMAEKFGPHVQTVVIDPEGEFASLREKLDMILVGQGGEIEANPRTAAALARRLAENHASAVIDIFELSLEKRRSFVRQFLAALIDVPRKLWHPMLVIIDEAHMYCPERGQGEAESTESVIDLMSRGRKRGFAGVLCTQRISKLHKDAYAECQNMFIGRCTGDIDIKRAADILGVGKTEWGTLRSVGDGEFFAFGPALPPGVSRLKSAQVATTHPEAGKRHELKPPAPSNAVKHMVAEMADLAARDPDEAFTLDQAQEIIKRVKGQLTLKGQEVTRLQKKLETAKTPVVAAPNQTVVKGASPQKVKALIAKAVQARDKEWKKPWDAMGKIMASVLRLGTELVNKTHTTLPTAPGAPPAVELPDASLWEQEAKLNQVIAKLPAQHTVHVPLNGPATPYSGDLPEGEYKVLTLVAQFGQITDRTQINAFTGFAVSTRNTYIQRLQQKGLLIEESVGAGTLALTATAAGMEALGDSFQPLPTGEALQAYWQKELPEGEGAILKALCESYPERASREAISFDFAVSTRNTYIQRLCQKKLAVADKHGVAASPHLFAVSS